MNAKAAQILEYWFADSQRWWKKDEAVDRHIRETWQEDLERAGAGCYDDWQEDPKSCLALVILLDQFSRNMHRGSHRSFMFDAKAREVVLAGVDRGVLFALSTDERCFFLMPLMHSERIEHQKRCETLFRALLSDCPEDKRERVESYVRYAVRHGDIVQRFGRFPHRNELLGRASTPEELTFLEQSGSSF